MTQSPTMEEVELKYLGPDLDKVRSALKRLGAQCDSPRALEVNLVFDDEDGSLRAQGRLLRLRDGRELTLKIPGAKDRFKRHTEITVHIADGAVEALLEGVGYSVTRRYDKYREGWDLDTMWVTLDELPFLGSVVEIEGNPDKIDEAAENLGLAKAETSTANYLELFRGYAEEHGLDPNFMTFEAEAKAKKKP